MYAMHIALGGCLKAPPISYGVTEDTGGHIAYVLGAAMAQAARPDIHRVDIVTRLFQDPDLDPVHAMADEPVSAKLRILRLRTGETRYLAKSALEAELPSLTAALLQHLADLPRRPDVLHCHFADAALLGLAARDRFGIPVIYSPHSLAIDKAPHLGAPDRARLAREMAAIRGSSAIIASSRDEAERQIPAYDADSAGRVWRINPGITLPDAPGPDRAAALLAATLARPDLPVLLAIARPVRKKNLRALLDAYIASPELQAAANLVIVAGQDLRGAGRAGAGMQPDEQDQIRQALRARIDAAGIADRVVMPPRHEPQLVPQLYARAALLGGVFVNPASHEPFGLTLIEAARFGLPVVATCHGGPGDIVAAIGHGRLIDPDAPGAIAGACLAIIGDRALWRAMSRNALANHDRFSWNRWAARTTLITRRLTAPAGAPAPMPLPQAMAAFDIDATMTGHRSAAGDLGRWITAAPGRRCHVVVATGRSVSEARRVLADWHLPEPPVMITSVGTEIWRRRRAGALELCRDYAARIGANWPRDDIAAALGAMGLRWQPACDQRQWKLSLFGSGAEAAGVAARLASLGLPARVIASHQRFIDVVPEAAGKAAAMAFEAARFGLSMADCIAAGDSGNDACMLGAAGRAIVVGNADPELQLPDRPGLYRARAAHAAGVLEGLSHFGLAAPFALDAIPAQ